MAGMAGLLAALIQLAKDAVAADWPAPSATTTSPLAQRELLDTPAIADLFVVPDQAEPLWVLEELDGLVARLNFAFLLTAREGAERRNLVGLDGGIQASN